MTDSVGAPFSYSELGETRSPVMPAGYHHLEMRRQIGVGGAAFSAAAARVLGWDMHRGAGLSIAAQTPVAAPGVDVVVRIGLTAKGFGVSAPCRVVYVVDEEVAGVRRAGFGYGTLVGHPERGEESFVVEMAPDGVVGIVIRAFSRPGTWWTAAAGPVGRLGQRVMTRRYLRAAGGSPLASS